MGDRAQIKIKEKDDIVYLYTHWNGYKIKEDLKEALIRGKGRWTDMPYLTRIIFCEMVKDDLMNDTGFGISSEELDGEIIEVDVTRQEVDGESFSKFVGE